MQKEIYVNLHDAVKIKFEDEKNIFNNRIKTVYERYENYIVEEIPESDLDITIKFGKFNPSFSNCVIYDNSIWVKNNYFYSKKITYKLNAFWEFDVSGLDEERLDIRIFTNYLGMLFVNGIIVDFFIFYILLKKNYSLIHASAIDLNGKINLFAARGGGGKTSIALQLLRNKKNKFLGDNFIIIKKNTAYSFITNFNIFGYNLSNSIWNNLSLIEKTFFILKNMIYKLSRGFIKVFTSFNPKRIFQEQITDKGKINSIFILHSKNVFKVEVQEEERVLSMLTSNIKLEFPYFMRITSLYKCFSPNHYFSNIWEKYINNLSKNIDFNKTNCMLLTLPKIMDNSTKEHLVQLIGDENAAKI